MQSMGAGRSILRGLLSLIISASACAPPADTSQSTPQLVLSHIVQPVAANDSSITTGMTNADVDSSPATASSQAPEFGIGLPELGATTSVSAVRACEGSTGSILPPMFLSQCVPEITQIQSFLPPSQQRQFNQNVGLPLSGLGTATSLLLNPNFLANTLTHLGETRGIPLAQQFRGAYTTQNQPATYTNGHIFLRGIEQYWVHQSVDNDCWAATLETARRFLHLPYVSQDQIREIADRLCQQLHHQRFGASTYQIVYAISKLHSSDGEVTSVHPHFCNSFACIVNSLTGQQPIIMLNSGHAVLVVGADYYSGTANGQSIVRYGTFYILDPAGNGNVKAKSLFSLCRADAFIAY